MSTENEILAEVEALKVRFSETKSLYREVCALLFFRYGIVPTSNKLYQYVRKGSMSAPAEALTKFWDELRSKARVEIDHPDLPPALVTTAAEAIGEIWRQATAAARGELAVLRVEAQSGLEAAQANLNAANAAAQEAADREGALKEEGARLAAGSKALADELEAERRSHAGVIARLQELQRHFDESKVQLERSRERFTADLALAKAAAEAAAVRSEAADRRAMVEVDQERQARAKAEKLVETLRTTLATAEGRARDLEVAHAAEATRLAGEVRNLQEALVSAQGHATEHLRRANDLQMAHDEQRARAIEASSEAATLRSVLEQTRAAPAPAKRTRRAPESGT